MVTVHFKKPFESGFILIFLLLFWCGLVNATQKSYTFHDLEKRVVEQDYSVVAALQRLRATESKLSATRSQFWPEFSSFYRYFPDGLSLSDDEFSSKHLLTLRLTQDLIKLTKVRSGKMKQSHAEVDIVETQLHESKRKALFEFRKEYIEILESRTRISYYQKLLDLSQNLVEIKKTRYRRQEGLLTELIQVEKESHNVRELLDYYQNRFKNQKKHVAELLHLNEFEIAWNDIKLDRVQIREERVLQAAIANSGEIKINEARARLEEGRASASLYESFRLAPYLGFRMRGESFTAVRTGTEVGIRFSLPLGYIKSRSQKQDQFKANENSWKLQAEQRSFELRKELSSAYDRYLLLEAQIKNTQKILELHHENMLIERSRATQFVRSIKVDPADLLEIKAETAKLNLQKSLANYERDKIYYELLYLAGFSWPDEMENALSKGVVTTTRNFPRALWLWNAPEILLQEESRLSFIRFCESRGVAQVFLSVNKEVMASLNQHSPLPNFITQLHQANINVSALFGEPLWVYEAHRNNLIQKMESVLNYHSRAAKTAHFDAIHLDVEPHTLAEWGDRKEALIHKLVQTLRSAKQVLSRNHSNIAIEVDIPAFYSKVDRMALKNIIAIADVVTIMAYERKSAEKVLASVKSIVDYATETNKRFILGLNAKDFEKEHDLKKLITSVARKFTSVQAFSGFAIHDYRHYRNLAKR